MKKTYMLDTNICSFIMREQPETLLKVLQGHVENKDRLVISAIVDQFMERIDGVLAWDRASVDATTMIKQHLAAQGTPIGSNDAAIAGNAIAAGCVLVTNNVREFERVLDLQIEDWTL